MSRSVKRVLAIIGISALTVVGFQNCAKNVQIDPKDLNSNGAASPGSTTAPSNPITVATINGQYFLANAGTNTPLMYNGATVTTSTAATAGWTPTAGAQTATGYLVVWHNSTSGLYTIWATDQNAAYLSNTIDQVAGTQPEIQNYEPLFLEDLNGDGVVGLTLAKTVIRTNGTTTLISCANKYLLSENNGGGPALRINGADLTTTTEAGWTPIGAVKVSSGYELAWYNSSLHEYTVWSVDPNGDYLSNIVPAVAGTNVQLENAELSFNQDLNGDGRIGP